MEQLRIVGIDGARREDSASRKLLHSAKPYFEEAGVDFHIFDQSKDKLPLFDGADNSAADPSVQKLVNWVQSAHGVIFCSPEYHGSMSGAIKNALDWLTLLDDKGRLKGKAVGLIGGGGALANSGAVVQMMMSVRALHGILMPEVLVSIPAIWDAFDDNGQLASDSVRGRMREFAGKLAAYARLFRDNPEVFG